MLVWIALISAVSAFPQFFFFFFFSATMVDPFFCEQVHCSRTYKLHFLSTFSLKIGPTVLFTHLKIILLQYFQFSIFNFSKISSIQTDPKNLVYFLVYHMHQISNYDQCSIIWHYVTVWITLILASTFPKLHFSFFFFFFCSAAIVDFVNCEQCIHALFTVPQITLFNNFFIKNGSHSTIYTFKNYFATVFSVSIFSFSKNKHNPNTP